MKRITTAVPVVLAVVLAACGGTEAEEAPVETTPTTMAFVEETTTTTMAPTTTEAPATTVAAAATIVDVAASAGQFETLLAAAQAAGLADTLASDGPFTVFAPTDAAFAALPEGTVEGLLADPEALGQILLYHVVPGRVTSTQVVELTSADTVQGSAIAIRVEDGKVFVNDAQVTTVDVEASNGVIHVIDSVLLPPTN